MAGKEQVHHHRIGVVHRGCVGVCDQLVAFEELLVDAIDKKVLKTTAMKSGTLKKADHALGNLSVS